MLEFLREFFSTSAFMPHGHCYLWEPGLLWLQVLGNSSIALAYFAISATLVYLARKGTYVPFKGVAVAFGIFIISCGFTHVMDVIVIWEPWYWLDGAIRAITAIASVGTAVMLPPLIPRAISLAQGARRMRDRGVELEAALDDLEDLYEKTQQLDRAKTEFFANVSHELRTPLALILGPAEKLLQSENLTSEQRGDLEVMLRNSRTLLKHVNDLLEVTRVEVGMAQPSYQDKDLGALVRLVAGHFDGIAAERDMEFVCDAPTVIADIDSDMIERVVLNLLSNAFKFTPRGGSVRLAVEEEEESVVITVEDSGPGVAKKDRELVFERFRQADGAANRTFGGTGLGLAISRDFVRLHRGELVLDEAPRGGARLRATLPRHAPAKTRIVESSPDSQPNVELERVTAVMVNELQNEERPRPQMSEGEGPLVLVVEDSADMNQFICSTLAPDYRTLSARNGVEGLELALAHRPDLVVSDVMMPQMTGNTLVGELRARPEFRTTPILVLTALTDDSLSVKLLRDGAQDYVSKPFSAAELRIRVGNLVTMKRVQDVLRTELASQTAGLETLAAEMMTKQRELRTAVESLKVARERAELASQMKTRFLSVVSHELRSPLATLQLQLERMRLEEESLSEGNQALLLRMMKSADRLQALIDSLLQYARIQSGKLSVRTDRVVLRELVQDTIDELQLQAEQKQLELTMEGPADLAVETDPSLLRLILVNLVGNAIKYTEQGGVRVTFEKAEGEVRLHVSDTGPGIDPDARARIFEPFEQIGSTRKKHEPGVGLGLALVKEMVSGIRASIVINSTVGEGSTFTVILPADHRVGQ